MDCQTVYLNMAEMRPLPTRTSSHAWIRSVGLLERWLGQHVRLDSLLEQDGREVPVQSGRARLVPGGEGIAPAGPIDPAEAATVVTEGQERARCQHLLFGAVRNLGRLEVELRTLIPRQPRARLQAVLLVSGFELLEAGAVPVEAGKVARIVHHAVAQAKQLLSPAEVQLVNAVLRQLARAPGLHAAPPTAAAGAPELARFYSHPEWLVQRWLAQFGADATRQLLQWNQMPPPVYARLRGDQIKPPGFLQPAPWAGFYVVPAGHWPEIERLLAKGTLYLQDPATALAPGLLDPKSGETILDLCAAPGGKSLLLADLLEQVSTASSLLREMKQSTANIFWKCAPRVAGVSGCTAHWTTKSYSPPSRPAVAWAKSDTRAIRAGAMP